MANSERWRDRLGDGAPAAAALPPHSAAAPHPPPVVLRALRVWRHGAPAAYMAPALAIYALFVLWPLLYLAALSFMHWDGYSTPSFAGLDNYGALWSDAGFATELGHSLTWLAVTLVAPPLLGLILALLLASAPARLCATARALLLLPLLLPSVVLVVAWRLFYNPLSGPLTGLLRTLGLGALAGDWLGDPRLALPALLLPACWAAFGLSMLIFAAALSAIDPAILAAAQVDGAGPWARLRLITLPSLRGAIPLAIIATALCAVPSYDLVHLMTDGGPGYATTILSLDMYGRAFASGQVGAGAAIACVQSAIGIILAALALMLVARRGPVGEERGADEGLHVRSTRAGRGAAGVALLAATGAVLFPLAWLLVLSAQPTPGSATAAPWTNLWQNVAVVWNGGLAGGFLTSVAVSAAVTVCTIVLAAPAAFALATRAGRRSRVVVLALLALGLFQPSIVLIIPLFTLLKNLAMLDSPLGLILPEVARVIPVAVLLLWLALRGLPSDVLAAAQVDGAAPYQVLRRVALPLAAPMVVVVALWAFLSSWNEYLLPTMVFQSESLQTVPSALASFVGRVDTQYGLLAGGALLAIAPLLAFYGLLYGAMASGMRGLRSVRQWL